MFLETAIAMFILGVIAGAWIVQLLRADTLMSENLALKQQQAERSWEREREAMEYEAFKNTHRGTPYLPKTPAVHEVAGRSVAHLDDNANGCCTCTYGAYANYAGGTGSDIVRYDKQCPEHGWIADNDRWSVKAPELRSVS